VVIPYRSFETTCRSRNADLIDIASKNWNRA